MSSTQACGKLRKHRQTNALRSTKNLPISFMPLDKIVEETKKAPEARGLALQQPITPLSGIFCPQTLDETARIWG
jgi:hypothetical protein